MHKGSNFQGTKHMGGVSIKGAMQVNFAKLYEATDKVG